MSDVVDLFTRKTISRTDDDPVGAWLEQHLSQLEIALHNIVEAPNIVSLGEAVQDLRAIALSLPTC